MLNKLPFETLDLVIQYIRYDQYSLLQLNSVCSLLHTLTIPYLYHSPELRNIDILDSFQTHLSKKNGVYVKHLSLNMIPLRWTDVMNPLLNKLTPKVPNLESLDLFKCHRLRNRTMVDALKLLPHLKWLSLEGCAWIGDVTIEGLVHSCPKIEFLFLSGTHVTDHALELIATHLSSIKLLHMNECEDITELGVDMLIEKCKFLKSLSIQYCFGVVGDYTSVFRTLRNTETNAVADDAGWEDIPSDEE
ncbi:hypothetical protein BDB01DRAFT_772732 [Pilobolus umbonatus]|nr:hypothetical protein BDB01DRAFT_772732 [Pilobolus umbonatus]